MPNGSMSSSNVTNFTRQGTRRMEWHFPLAADANIKDVQKAILEAITADSRVLTTQEPTAAVSTFSDGQLKVSAYAWVTVADYLNTFQDFNAAILTNFRTQGINLAIPVSIVKVQQA